MAANRPIEQKILAAILWLYIVLCFVIAGLNYGVADQAAPEIAQFINKLFQFYENELKTIFIIICSILTWRLIRLEKMSVHRRNNLIGLSLSALMFHVIVPGALANKDIYYLVMPLPWSTTGLQLMQPESSFYTRHLPLWGLAGISAAVIFFIIMNFLVLIGTLLWGRRLQCSTLCLMNGFASEIWAPVFPLIGRKKVLPKSMMRLLTGIRWIIMAISVFFMIWWLYAIAGFSSLGSMDWMAQLEVIKYLSLELLMAMFFWVVWTGRGYCYYCPLGTFLSLISRIAGQRIRTDATNCIGCNKCNRACPMQIDLATPARTGDPVNSLKCVGCGHCIDACPTQNLVYSTKFADWVRQNRQKYHDKNVK